MKEHRVTPAARIILAAFASLSCLGCETTTRYFKVSSYPEGAMIYVDGEPRGQTNFARLAVDFPEEESRVTIRLGKEGYQTTGAVLSRATSPELAFFLADAPKNQEILDVLRSILQSLDRMAAEMRQLRQEEAP